MSDHDPSRRQFLQWAAGTAGALLASGKSEAAPRQGRRTVAPARETPLASRRISPEGKEWPPGADGFDQHNYPYGLKLRGIQYVQSKENEPQFELADPIEGRNKVTGGNYATDRSGQPVLDEETGEKKLYEVILTKETSNVWQEAKAAFNIAAAENPILANYGWFLTQGFRSWDDQVKQRALEGAGAALPGKSAHQIGRAVDIFKANRFSMYAWLTGFDGKTGQWPPAGFVPPLVRLGIIPTEPAEPWHWEFIGSSEEKLAEAAAYWQKHKRAIINEHSKKLREDDK